DSEDISKFFSTFPIPMENCDFFFKKSERFTFVPEFETFRFNLEEENTDVSFPGYECFYSKRDIHLFEKFLNEDPSSPLPLKDIKTEELKSVKSSIGEPPDLEFKDLPSYLEYAFLEEDNIISELPPCVAITPTKPVDSLSMGDEHLDTIPETKSDEFIKSSVENLVPNPSESEGENECDVPAGFKTFSNVLFDAEYDFDSSDDQSFSDEDLSKKIYSNPLFDEEIIPMKINLHSFNAEYDLIESMPNHDSSIIISSKIDSLFDEFVGELTLLKSIPLGIDETDCHLEEKTHFTKRLLYDNSSPRPPEEFYSDAEIESFSPSPILIEDSDFFIEEIDLTLTPDDPIPSIIEEDDHDSERDILILE
nr:reverse transcriptase domain-containing protein [Tanacetum cinerariifolium]